MPQHTDCGSKRLVERERSHLPGFPLLFLDLLPELGIHVNLEMMQWRVFRSFLLFFFYFIDVFRLKNIGQAPIEVPHHY